MLVLGAERLHRGGPNADRATRHGRCHLRYDKKTPAGSGKCFLVRSNVRQVTEMTFRTTTKTCSLCQPAIGAPAHTFHCIRRAFKLGSRGKLCGFKMSRAI